MPLPSTNLVNFSRFQQMQSATYTDSFLYNYLVFYPQWQWEKHLFRFLDDENDVKETLKRIKINYKVREEESY